MLGLAGAQRRENGVDAEVIHPGPVDPAEQGVGEPFHDTVTQASPEQLTDGHVGAREHPREHDVGRGAQLLRPAQDPVRAKGPSCVGRTRPIPSGIGRMRPETRRLTERGSLTAMT